MCRSSTASPVSRVKADPDLSGLPSNVSFLPSGASPLLLGAFF
jgi:hypothetical protein